MIGNPDYCRCDELGCDLPGDVCWPPDEGNPNAEPFYYCRQHAGKNGFCWMCGEFWAGVESFEMDPDGVCDNCRVQMGREDYEDYEDEEGAFYPREDWA